jgi:hypothetical protein
VVCAAAELAEKAKVMRERAIREVGFMGFSGLRIA